MKVTLILPFPARALSPNERTHYQAFAAAKKLYRQQCKIDALVARKAKTIKLEAPVLARLTFICKGQLWDEDNALAAFKAGLDGIVESGLIPGDDPAQLHIESSVRKGQKACVWVELEEVVL